MEFSGRAQRMSGAQRRGDASCPSARLSILSREALSRPREAADSEKKRDRHRTRPSIDVLQGIAEYVDFVGEKRALPHTAVEDSRSGRAGEEALGDGTETSDPFWTAFHRRAPLGTYPPTAFRCTARGVRPPRNAPRNEGLPEVRIWDSDRGSGIELLHR